jgi:serine/threonine-protein kinase RsbW
MASRPPRALIGRARFTNRLADLHAIHQFVRGLAIEAGFLDQALGDIELAVVEACANVVKHAYRGHPEASMPIDLEVWLDEPDFCIVITDRGQPFEPPTGPIPRPDPARLLERRPRGGLGLYFIVNLMDEVDWELIPGAPNRLRLVKRRSSC